MSESVEAEPVAPPASKGGIVPILLVINSLLLVGAVGFLVLRGSPGSAAKGEGEKSAEHGEGGHGGGAAVPVGLGPTVRIPDFVVHLRNPEADRYARMTFELEVANDKDKEEVSARMPQIRDAFISYLSDRTMEELRGSQGIELIKESLMKRVEQVVPGSRVRALFITDFVIQ